LRVGAGEVRAARSGNLSYRRAQFDWRNADLDLAIEKINSNQILALSF
jgi:hypothetical protein